MASSSLLLLAATAMHFLFVAAAGQYDDPTFVTCSPKGNYTGDSQYKKNLDQLLGALPAAARDNGWFSKGSAGAGADEAFGLIMCFADRNATECLDCLSRAPAGIKAACPGSRNAKAAYHACVLRYAAAPITDTADLDYVVPVNPFIPNTSDAVRAAWVPLMSKLTGDVATSPLRISNSSTPYWGPQVGRRRPSRPQEMYGLAQCTRDLNASECVSCISNYTQKLGSMFPNNTFGALKGYSCYLRYQVGAFDVTLPAVPAQPPSPQAAPGGSSGYARKGGNKLILLVAGVSVAGIVGFLFCLALARQYHLQRRKGRTAAKEKSTGALTYFRGEAVEVIELEQGTGTRRFSYEELAAATTNFSDDRKLGEGGFGSVYCGFLEDLNLDVAVKRVSKSSRQGWKEFMSEVRIISRLRHPNLVRLVGWCYGDGDELLLVYELMHNGSVDSHLYNPTNKTLTWEVRYEVVLGIGSALQYLHQETELCVVHRDIKPSNVMLDASFAAKLGDFGLARVVEDGRRSRTTAAAGTTGYVDPECLNTGRTSVESDVYSFGVVLLEIACGRCPVVTLQNGSTVHLVHRVWELHEAGRILEAADARLDGEYNVREMERVLAVGLWCAHRDRSQRPDIRHALNMLRFAAPLPILPAKSPAAAAHLQPVADALFDSATRSCGAPVISAAGSNGRGIELV